jgi:hypothetical protein
MPWVIRRDRDGAYYNPAIAPTDWTVSYSPALVGAAVYDNIDRARREALIANSHPEDLREQVIDLVDLAFQEPNLVPEILKLIKLAEEQDR